MKLTRKTNFLKQTQRIIYTLFLTSILSFGTGLTLMQFASAVPYSIQQTSFKILASESDRNTSLPPSVVAAVRQELSRKLKVPPEKLKVITYSQENWPDGCLGLSKADEFCTQALVPGWRITLSHNRQTWVYRSDQQGSILRLENQQDNK